MPAGHVVEQLRRGYRLRDRVIRPAMVAVAEGGFDAAGDAQPEADTNINRPLN